jgi:hypothetical protein
MTDNNINQTGNLSSQEDQMKISSLITSKEDLKKLSNEQLVELYKENNYSLDAIDRYYNFPRDTSRRYYSKRKINYKEISNEHQKFVKDEYNKNPNKCQHCGKELDWEHRNNKYCCRSCSVSEANKKVVRNSAGKNGSKGNNENNKLDLSSSKRHNDLISSKYHDINLTKIDPGCCPICGEYHCTNQFCKDHNFQQLIGFVKYLGFNPKTIGTKDVFEEFERIRTLVYDLYWDKGMSSIDLGEKFKYPCGIMTTDIFNHLNIPKRSYSEATSNAIILGKSSGFINNCNSITGLSKNIIQCWHTTWFGEKVFLRSSYEIDYANTLDNLKIYYLVEHLRIEYFNTAFNSNRIAIPDFYLPNTNEIIEIKSDFTLDIQEMLDKFESYKRLNYTPKLVLEHEEIDLYDIENQVSLNRLNRINNRNIKSFMSRNRHD